MNQFGYLVDAPERTRTLPYSNKPYADRSGRERDLDKSPAKEVKDVR